jgi:hypothetical protein
MKNKQIDTKKIHQMMPFITNDIPGVPTVWQSRFTKLI